MKKNQKSGLLKNDQFTRIQSLILDLKSKNGVVRENAREKLVAMGAPAVSHLAELINKPAVILRWESVKALGQIAKPGTAPLFISALCDRDEEVRWLAAEGLIALGPRAIKPLLQALMKNSKSVHLRKGAHHYFTTMGERNKTSQFNDLISAIESHDAVLSTPGAAEKLFKNMKYRK